MSKITAQLEHFRGLSPEHRLNEIDQRRRQLFQLRVQQMTGEVDNHRQLRSLRKEIARISTIMNEASAEKEPTA